MCKEWLQKAQNFIRKEKTTRSEFGEYVIEVTTPKDIDVVPSFYSVDSASFSNGKNPKALGYCREHIRQQLGLKHLPPSDPDLPGNAYRILEETHGSTITEYYFHNLLCSSKGKVSQFAEIAIILAERNIQLSFTRSNEEYVVYMRSLENIDNPIIVIQGNINELLPEKRPFDFKRLRVLDHLSVFNIPDTYHTFLIHTFQQSLHTHAEQLEPLLQELGI